MDRIRIILYGCLIWACMTWLFGLTRWMPHPFVMGCIVWAFNGLGLSLVIPNSQSVVADYYTEDTRGKAFGLLYFTSSVGAIIGSIYATNLAGVTLGGVEGWQLVMFTLAIVSAVVGILNIVFAKDPRDIPGFVEDNEEKSGKKDGWKDAWEGIGVVVRIPTFLIIILQGVVGSMPWKGIASFATLYLQLIGMSNAKSSIIQAAFLIGTACGGLLGGYLGDKAAQLWPNHGRIFVCQFSVLSGIPLSVLNYILLPRNGELSTLSLYVILFFIQGLLISWAAPSCNSPIFAEIVPPRMRNLIYAFDRCFEDALASPASFFVGWAAGSIFGFQGDATTSGNRADDLARADALGKAIMWFSVVPWTLCLIFYTGLHFTYRHDKGAASYQPLPGAPRTL